MATEATKVFRLCTSVHEVLSNLRRWRFDSYFWRKRVQGGPPEYGVVDDLWCVVILILLFDSASISIQWRDPNKQVEVYFPGKRMSLTLATSPADEIFLDLDLHQKLHWFHSWESSSFVMLC